MKILVVYTGGTLGMVKDEISGALKPGSIKGIEHFLEKENFLNHCHLTSTSTLVDSSNFNKKYYSELSVIIKQNYSKYDAFLVLMGTDTMAYISSLLSFCISGLAKPIIFTGGQKTLYEQDSDSVKNLKGAIQKLIENKFPNEVGIYFSEQWHRAVCTTKHHTKDFDAYVSIINHSYIADLSEEFSVVTKVSANPVIIKITPFNDENLLFTLLKDQKINIIILEIFGSGNMPEFSEGLKRLFKERINEGLKVVVTSQCMYGGLEIGRYESSLNISSLGVLNAGSMTKESIVGKLMFLVEKKLNIQEFRTIFENSVRGE
ncbi:asparaginase domain-containing protein [Wenyingzhuangia sp. chi5]|uniref:Asparaginase domain-containing protein n=1 Tax=Wenyingzhuangia gilva TaxID=3057677 RepID=A0ABT8VTX4_9FLAO|nr:asparaginase domain-containing protein [Wenyingzhuangia sp. chi5]MDO3695424.1 asparaginase domain-containing protein [Wenyingzhuangia sp. chi5]